MAKRTQADRDEDLALGRELERKDAEIERLRAALDEALGALAGCGPDGSCWGENRADQIRKDYDLPRALT